MRETESAELLTVYEFLHLTGISEADLVSMLANGELTVTSGTTQELLIDISDLDPEDLAKRSASKRSSIDENDLPLFEESIASELVSSLDDIISEAFEMALRWKGQHKG